MSHSAILFTRPNCCLCDAARQLLEKYRVAVSSVDIDTEPTLRERYNTCVPVVFIDGKERFRGRIDERLLRRIVGQ